MMNDAEWSSSLSAKDKLSSAAQTYSVSGYCRSEQMVYCGSIPENAKFRCPTNVCTLGRWPKMCVVADLQAGAGLAAVKFSCAHRSTTFCYKHLVDNHACSEKQCIKMAAKYGSVGQKP